MSDLPDVTAAKLSLDNGPKKLFIGAYGFEERALGWARMITPTGAPLQRAILFRYINGKGRNRVHELQQALRNLGCSDSQEIKYQVRYPQDIEDIIEARLTKLIPFVDEIIVDITAMTKFLILVLLFKLAQFDRRVRIVYSEAEEYAPSEAEYIKSKSEMELIAKYPSRGSESILRARCLSSIRMQGQPVTLVAFTSFNEQLVRHMLGTITPHRLILINGQPPRKEYAWRERATQEIHAKLIEEYSEDNPLDGQGKLLRATSTLDYLQTVSVLEQVHTEFGHHERIIIAATGSKMQTVGLFVHKSVHPDVHVEYPTPDSYYVTGMSKRIWQVHEADFSRFATILRGLGLSSKT